MSEAAQDLDRDRQTETRDLAQRRALSGSIRAGVLADVIAWIADAGWRGELAVEDEIARRALHFDQGNVVGAESDAVDDRLGDVLLRTGDLTKEQVTACRVLTESGRVRFGQAAVELGYLTRDELFSRKLKRVEAALAASASRRSPRARLRRARRGSPARPRVVLARAFRRVDVPLIADR